MYSQHRSFWPTVLLLRVCDTIFIYLFFISKRCSLGLWLEASWPRPRPRAEAGLRPLLAPGGRSTPTCLFAVKICPHLFHPPPRVRSWAVPLSSWAPS